MSHLIRFLGLSLILSLSGNLLAKPLSIEHGLSISAKSQLALTDLDALQKASDESSKNAAQKKDHPVFEVSPYKVAEADVFNRPLSDLGAWQNLGDDSIWQLQLSSPKALHLSFGLKQFTLPESAILYVIDSQTGETLARYDASDVKFHGELWSKHFNSSSITLELNVPTLDKAQVNFTLVQVNQGIKAVEANILSEKSGACNIDVVCSLGDNWRNEIRSVARYLISDPDGTFLCSGQLVNNSLNDREPLFLTAAHCRVSDLTAPTMVFFWNYETSTCNGTPNGSTAQSQNGASLVSRWETIGPTSDFALVRLDEHPDPNFNVYFAGWDRRDQAHTGVIAIHHPSGDEKRISQDTDPLTITGYTSNTEALDELYLRVGDWEQGTTEGGSSGSAIWNSARHIVGTLSGGLAACAGNLPNDQADWYGRMASHWLGSGGIGNQLAVHLAKTEPARETLDGIDSCSAPTISLSAGSQTINPGESIQFQASASGGSGSGYTFSWDFDEDGTSDGTGASINQAFADTGEFDVRLQVTDGAGCPASDSLRVLVLDATEQFLANGELSSAYVKGQNDRALWVVTDERSSEGSFSLRAPVINSDETASVEVELDFQAGNVSFDYRVSSEVDFDFFRFFIDGVEQLERSGEVDWTNVSFPLTAGVHRLRWTYSKDLNTSDGEDTAWIDNLSLPDEVNEAPVVSGTILTQSLIETESLTIDASNYFSDPNPDDVLSYQVTGAPESLSIDAATGVLSGTLALGDADGSPYSITITASDGELEASISFTLQVQPFGQPVVTTAISNQTSTEGDVIELDISVNFSDPEDEALTFSMANGPGSLSIDPATGIISGTLSSSDVAGSPYTVTVTATDGTYSVSDEFTWTVNSAPPPPSSGGGGGGGGSMGLALFALLLSLLVFRQVTQRIEIRIAPGQKPGV